MGDSNNKRAGFFRRTTSKLGENAAEDRKGPQGEESTPENFTMMQAFEWYVPDDHKHYKRLEKALAGLKATGVDNLWIPPGCKASGPSDNGYGVYDLYDLGEFDAKGTTATKWGTKEELLSLCHKAKESGVGIYFDAVLNHKAAADRLEKCRAVPVDENNRLTETGPPREINAWLGFEFSARGDKYSKQKYHWYHFTGTDWDDATKTKGVFKLLGDGKNFADDVDSEKGNFDYLMFADLDYSHPEVIADVKNWGVWITKELGLRGFRFDAIKHFSEDFLLDFIRNLDSTHGQGWFLVGEFWKTALADLTAYLEKMDHKFSLFDAPLVSNFSNISNTERADMRKVFDGTLVQCEPYNAVTLVANHDTQPSQALEMPISDWFVPLAYSLILLRADGYPCLFYGDVFGLKGGVKDDWKAPGAQGKILDITLVRKLFAYGEQNDYFEDPNLIGWVRRGTWDKPDGCAIVMSNADMGEKKMFVGEVHNGEKWTDILGWSKKEVAIEGGFGVFECGSCSVSIFVKDGAQGRERLGKFDDKIYE